MEKQGACWSARTNWMRPTGDRWKPCHSGCTKSPAKLPADGKIDEMFNIFPFCRAHTRRVPQFRPFISGSRPLRMFLTFFFFFFRLHARVPHFTRFFLFLWIFDQMLNQAAPFTCKSSPLPIQCINKLTEYTNYNWIRLAYNTDSRIYNSIS